ncbi:MAG: ThiF family adenylyltransferase [Candidatus Nanohaloarchaea archaeon]
MHQRFTALKNYGENDLKQLKNSTVAVIGLGTTGSVIAEHLARHGVKLKIFDRDYLEEKDLYTSTLYTREDTEKALPKAVAAEKHLEQFTEVEKFNKHVKPGETSELEDVELIMDGTDNIRTRQLINDFSKKHGIPWIYTAVVGEKGYSMLFDQKCFNCLLNNQKQLNSLETCETAGVMRETASIIASKSSRKAIKLLTGENVTEKLETVSESFEVETNSCKVCREEEFHHLERSESSASLCGENKYLLERKVTEAALERLKQVSEVEAENKHLVQAKIGERQLTVFRDGRIIVEARDKGHAEATVSEALGI